ncbi:MAG: S-adenosylmethionine decarboxylase, partial [Myxococcota bacterium]
MIGPDAESRVAIRMTPGAGDLRTRGRTYWETLVARSGATILSACSSEACEAYLLSESSLFVWSDRLTLITCGQTCLVDAVEALLDEDGAAVASRSNHHPPPPPRPNEP